MDNETTTPTPQEILADSHTLMCQRVHEILQNPESSVQELKVAADWLHKNGVSSMPIPGSPLGQVVEAAHQRNTNPHIIQLPTYIDGDILDDDDPAVPGEATRLQG